MLRAPGRVIMGPADAVPAVTQARSSSSHETTSTHEAPDPVVKYFGPPWPAPIIDDAVPTITPVGSHCIDCDETIVSGDQGFLQPCLSIGEDVQYLPIHRECRLLGVIGHGCGWCSCTDYQGLTRRQAALRLWEDMTERRASLRS